MNSWEQRERALSILSKETGYVRKAHGDRLRVALAFPNTYWVGMSNLGFQTVYRLFNECDDIVCERVFLPPKQELAELLARRTPIVTLESQTPAGFTTMAAGAAAGATAPVRKAAVKSADALDPPSTGIFTPDTEFGSRFLVEVVRGCANLCRFCWAGYNYLPVRAFPADRIIDLAQAARVYASRAGLVSIALCDHPEIDRILARLFEMGYAISPASLRLDDLTEAIVRVLRASGERTITIAPETGSDRLRRVVNKTVTNDEILDRAELIFASGIEN